MSALGTDRAFKRRLDLFGKPANESGTPAMAQVPIMPCRISAATQAPLGNTDAQAPARLIRYIRPPPAAAGIVGVIPRGSAA
jgi:hypothetical protein